MMIQRQSADLKATVHVPNFGGLSGSEDRVGGDNSIQFINFGRVGDKSFKEWRQKWRGGGGRVGDNNILTFSLYCTRLKNVTFLFIFIHICLFIKLTLLPRHVTTFSATGGGGGFLSHTPENNVKII